MDALYLLFANRFFFLILILKWSLMVRLLAIASLSCLLTDGTDTVVDGCDAKPLCLAPLLTVTMLACFRTQGKITSLLNWPLTEQSTQWLCGRDRHVISSSRKQMVTSKLKYLSAHLADHRIPYLSLYLCIHRPLNRSSQDSHDTVRARRVLFCTLDLFCR